MFILFGWVGGHQKWDCGMHFTHFPYFLHFLFYFLCQKKLGLAIQIHWLFSGYSRAFFLGLLAMFMAIRDHNVYTMRHLVQFYGNLPYFETRLSVSANRQKIIMRTVWTDTENYVNRCEPAWKFMRTGVNQKHTLAIVTLKNMWTGVNWKKKLCEPVRTVVRTNWKSVWNTIIRLYFYLAPGVVIFL